MLMMPDFVSQVDLEQAKAAMAKKKKLDTKLIRLEKLHEGKVV